MLLVQDPKLLLLDEPVAGMTGHEREKTGELLHTLAGQHTIIVTEHDMDFVRRFARDGDGAAPGQGAHGRHASTKCSSDATVVEVYLGRADGRDGMH